MSRLPLPLLLALACGSPTPTLDGGSPPLPDGSDDGAVPHPEPVCGDDGRCATLFVQEALPGFDEGRARRDAPVTFGVPVPPGIAEASQLAVEGAPGQVRPLRRRRDGSLEWVAIDARVDLGPREVAELALVAGEGAGDRTPLATEGDPIEVDTGAATFTFVSPGGDALLRSAIVGGTERLTAPLALTGRLSEGAAALRTVVESVAVRENGPEATMVRVEGALVEDDSIEDGTERSIAFTARLRFVADATRVDAEVTLRNDRVTDLAPIAFRSLGLTAAVALGEEPVARFGMEGEAALEGPVGEAAWLVQGIVEEHPFHHRAFDCYPVPPPLAGECVDGRFVPATGTSGVEVGFGGAASVAGGNQRVGAGNLFASGSEGSVAVALRWMANMYPASLEVRGDGALEVGFFSERHPDAGHELARGAHETRRVLLDFAPTDTETATDLSHALDRPLIGRPDFEEVRASRAFYGTDQLLTPEEQARFFESRGDEVPWTAELDGRSVRIPRQEHYRRHYFENDGAILDFLRTGDASHWLMALTDAEFEMDTAFGHSFEFDLATSEVEPGGTVPYDGAHGATVYMQWAALLSASERMHEALLDYGEFEIRRSGRFPERYGSQTSFRTLLRALQHLAWVYDYTRDERYLDVVRDILDFLLDTPFGAEPYGFGRSAERGFVYFDEYGFNGYPEHRLYSFFHVEIMGSALQDVVLVLARNGLEHRTQELEDLMVGHALFWYREAYDETTGHHFDLFGAPPGDVQSAHYVGAYWATLLYDVLGDEAVLERVRHEALTRWDGCCGGEPSRRQNQSFMHVDLHRPPPRDAWAPVAVDVDELPDGRHRIRWTPPEGVARYRLKHADRPIVEWLGYDRDTGEYALSPLEHATWWSSAELEPPSGSMDEWVVEGLERGTHFYLMASTR